MLAVSFHSFFFGRCLHPLKFQIVYGRIYSLLTFTQKFRLFCHKKLNYTRDEQTQGLSRAKFYWFDMRQKKPRKQWIHFSLWESLFKCTAAATTIFYRHNISFSPCVQIRLGNKNATSLPLSISRSPFFVSTVICFEWANYHYAWLACTFWLFIKLCVVRLVCHSLSMFTIIRAEKQYRNARIPRRVSFNTLTLSRDIERSGEGCGKKTDGSLVGWRKKKFKAQRKIFSRIAVQSELTIRGWETTSATSYVAAVRRTEQEWEKKIHEK